MIAATELERLIVEAFAAEAAPVAPERVLQGVLERTRSTGQRRPRLGRGLTLDTRRLALLGIVAAAALAIVGIVALAGRARDEPTPTASPAPTAVATPSPSAAASSLGIGVPTEPFTSMTYSYSLRHPAGWIPSWATSEWSSGQPVDEGLADHFVSPAGAEPVYDVWVASAPFALGVDEEVESALATWVAGAMPSRQSALGDCLPPARPEPSAAGLSLPQTWQAASVPGMDAALAREACGFIDEVAVASDRVFVFVMHGPSAGDGVTQEARAGLDAIVATLDPVPGGDLPQPSDGPDSTFVSGLYGYSITQSSSWRPNAATKHWTGGRGWSISPMADVLEGPGDSFFAVASVAVPDGTDLDDWLAQADLVRPEAADGTNGSPRGCEFHRGAGAVWMLEQWDDTWSPYRIGGADGRIRVLCGFIDAATIVEDRLFVVSMRGEFARSVIAPLDTFAGFAGAIAFEGTFRPAPPPAMTEPFESERYGLSLRYPTGWTWFLTSRTWTRAGEAWDEVADRFDAGSTYGTTYDDRDLFAASIAVPVGASEDSWLAAFMPPATTVRDGCTFPTEERVGSWQQREVAGLPARWRGSCGHVEGVVFTGGRAHVFVAEDAVTFDRTRDATRALFDAWVATVVLHPEEAVDGPASAALITSSPAPSE